MKKEDLMIGDWVFDMNNRPGQITSIDCYGTIKTTNDYTEVSIIINNPIPLTKEILEKNGFKTERFFIDYEIEYLWIINDVDVFYIIEDYRGNDFALCKLYLDYKESTQIIDICPINYVHELQHIFRLLKIDKEIEL